MDKWIVEQSAMSRNLCCTGLATMSSISKVLRFVMLVGEFDKDKMCLTSFRERSSLACLRDALIGGSFPGKAAVRTDKEVRLLSVSAGGQGSVLAVSISR